VTQVMQVERFPVIIYMDISYGYKGKRSTCITCVTVLCMARPRQRIGSTIA